MEMTYEDDGGDENSNSNSFFEEQFFVYIDLIIGVVSLVVSVVTIIFMVALILLILGKVQEEEDDDEEEEDMDDNILAAAVVADNNGGGGENVVLGHDEQNNNNNKRKSFLSNQEQQQHQGQRAMMQKQQERRRRRIQRLQRQQRKEKRQHQDQGYNLYLLFLILPDAITVLSTTFSMFWRVGHNIMSTSSSGGTGYSYRLDGRIGEVTCMVQQFMGFFYYFGNTYLNAVLAYRVYTLVVNSYQRKRTKPPSIRVVLRDVLLVYTGGILFGCWGVINSRASTLTSDFNTCSGKLGLGFRNDNNDGGSYDDMDDMMMVMGDEEEEEDDDDAKVAWYQTSGFTILLLVVTLTPALLYVFVTAYKVWKRNLLPIRGRTRALAIYFFRIVIVFLSCYIPNVAVICAALSLHPVDDIVEGYYSKTFHTLHLTYYVLCAIQCFITVYLARWKEDIQTSINYLLRKLSCSRICQSRKRRNKRCKNNRKNGNSIGGNAPNYHGGDAPNKLLQSPPAGGASTVALASQHDTMASRARMMRKIMMNQSQKRTTESSHSTTDRNMSYYEETTETSESNINEIVDIARISSSNVNGGDGAGTNAKPILPLHPNWTVGDCSDHLALDAVAAAAVSNHDSSDDKEELEEKERISTEASTATGSEFIEPELPILRRTPKSRSEWRQSDVYEDATSYSEWRQSDVYEHTSMPWLQQMADLEDRIENDEEDCFDDSFGSDYYDDIDDDNHFGIHGEKNATADVAPTTKPDTIVNAATRFLTRSSSPRPPPPPPPPLRPERLASSAPVPSTRKRANMPIRNKSTEFSGP